MERCRDERKQQSDLDWRCLHDPSQKHSSLQGQSCSFSYEPSASSPQPQRLNRFDCPNLCTTMPPNITGFAFAVGTLMHWGLNPTQDLVEDDGQSRHTPEPMK
eukprot:2637234-Amphidinium_carterae.1